MSLHDSTAIRGNVAEQLRELAQRWVQGRLSRGEIVPGSATTLASRLESLLGMCDGLSVEALTAWQASIGQMKPRTRQAYVSTVNQFCGWLVDEGHITQDPRRALAKVRVVPGAPRALPPFDIDRIVKAATDARWAAVVTVMVGVGLRCVEVSRLDLADLDRDRWTLFVTGKGGHQRMLPLPQTAQEALDDYLAERGTRPGPLFLSAGSRSKPDRRLHPRWISRKVSIIMYDAGVHDWGDGRSAHALRHTCLSDVLEACHDVRIVQQVAGHASLATTQVYLRVANLGQLRSALQGGVDIRGPTIRHMAGPLGGAGSPGATTPEAPDPT